MNATVDPLNATQLMKRILEVRFSDSQEMQLRCDQLLSLAEAANDSYGCAFANVYLLDCALTLGDFNACGNYLARAEALCKENSYDDLMMRLHLIAGLYLQGIMDDRSALQRFMSGLVLAKQLHETVVEGKLLNNIGICFRRRNDNPAAIAYFRLSYKALEPRLKEFPPETIGTAITFLCNLAEAYQYENLLAESEATLLQADAFTAPDQYWEFHRSYTWCSHYAACGDKERSIALAKQLLADGLAEFDQPHFTIGAFVEVCNAMLLVDCRELALRYLQLLGNLCSLDNVGDYYHYQVLKIRYYERFGTAEECDRVYKEFYEISTATRKNDNAVHVKNVLSKIELTNALLDREEMRRKHKELEDASHIDELTQLYNRRYLSKLLSKVAHAHAKTSIGYIMMDVDYFKQFNDFYGHVKGDGALRCVADVLRAHSSEGAYACRCGGDEFLVLCVNWSDEKMEEFVRSVQADLHTRNVPHERSKTAAHLSLTIGYSNGPYTDEQAPSRLLKAADLALYRAKQQGRNCFARADNDTVSG